MVETLSTNLELFLASSRKESIAAREALLNADFVRLNVIMGSIQESKPVKDITNIAGTTYEALDRLIEKFQRAIPGLKVIAGLSIVGAGAIIWGAGFALAPLIGFCLIAYGISVALPAAWQMVEQKLNDWYENLDLF